MFGRRVALAAGALVLGAVPVARVATSSSSPPPEAATTFVKPILECVVKTGHSYQAWFGYENTRSTPVTIPVKMLLNHFAPPPMNRGQPTTFQPGRHAFVFSATFSSSLTWVLGGQPAIAKSTSPKCSGPKITTVSLPDGTVGGPYSAVVEATGGVPPLTFSATGLPPGLNIAASGAISGSPTAAGTFTVKVTVTDKIGQKATKDYSLEVEGVLLECGESTTAGGEGTPSADLTLEAGEGCTPVTVVLRTEGDTVQLIKPDSPNTFTMVIDWEPEPAQYPLAATVIDYGSGEQTVQWCPGPGQSRPDQDWCLVTQHAEAVGGGQVQVTETFFGKNDPSWTRR